MRVSVQEHISNWRDAIEFTCYVAVKFRGDNRYHWGIMCISHISYSVLSGKWGKEGWGVSRWFLSTVSEFTSILEDNMLSKLVNVKQTKKMIKTKIKL